ncbi:hypothetical protein ABIC65_000192 [Sphingomonas trueperi]|uniref:DUF5335 domain-containing protein n=1 Tax=Sphingomonas trueperi TaxID=53317 RepID=UPI003395209A
MAFSRLDRSAWQAFFDTFTRALIGKRAEIEVASLDLGDQILAEWLPLLGMSYDRKDDLVEIKLDGVDHLIRSPREIHADHVAGTLLALEIIDGDDRHQIVRFANPVALPPPVDSPQPTQAS